MKNEKGESLIPTIILTVIIILTVVFIAMILKTGGKTIDFNPSVDLTNGVTYDKQVAFTINSNLRSYMDKEMSYNSVSTLINVAKTNNRDAESNSDYKTVYFEYGGKIVSPDDLLPLISEGKKYSATTDNSNKSDDTTDEASYYLNGQIKLISIKNIEK